MNRRTTALIIILSLVSALLIFLAFTPQKPKTKTYAPVKKPTITARPVEKIATVFFSQREITAHKNTPTTIDFMVDTHGKPITGVQIELLFNPRQISQVKLSAPLPDSFFGKQSDYIILFSEVNPLVGKASYAIAVLPTKESKSGAGVIGRLTFSLVSSENAQITFGENTLVTRENETESVLKNTIPLTITASATK